MLPYSKLRDSNVAGTKEILQICATHHLKKLCYVSSLSVYGVIVGKVKEERLSPLGIDKLSGYGYELGIRFVTADLQ